MGAGTRKTILVVDDTRLNRAVLASTLRLEYDIVEAADGMAAMALLNERKGGISAVVLDLVMPNMDGFEVLRRMRDSAALSSIPVIVATASDDDESTVRAFELGAMDLFTKPFHGTVLLKRIQNIISRKEADAAKAKNETLSLLRARDQKHIEELRRQAEYDSLTGLYNYNGFCLAVAKLLRDDLDGEYLIVRYDINHFKVVNDLWGKAVGDRLLCNIAKWMKAPESKISIAGRVGSDDFLACLRRDTADRERTIRVFNTAVSECGITNKLQIICGVAIADDPTISPELLCDRAELALEQAKKSAGGSGTVCYFEESMKNKLLLEQEIVESMHGALANGEFQFYLQPQVNQFTHRIGAAEALVRWVRPEKGMISPGEFIPIFEKNGFIEKLDRYVCERVCAFQRDRLLAGKRTVPISVNISRIDIYDETLCDFLTGLLKQYGLPASLLNLEITESAFMEDTEQLIGVVKRLQSAGFIVEIDDFGSAYSSLNMLKEISANILKLDIKFIDGDDAKASRGGNILSSILRMSRRLNMNIIVEGVETPQQAAYLKNIGFRYIQGYLYYKPMPVPDFEKIMEESETARLFEEDGDGEALQVNYWDRDSQNNLIMNTYIGSAAILEYSAGDVDVLRVNQATYETLHMTVDELERYRVRLPKLFNEENRRVYFDVLHPDNPQWYRVRARLLSKRVDDYLLYSTVENTTERHRLLNELQRDQERYHAIVEKLGAISFEWDLTTGEFLASPGYASYDMSRQDNQKLLKNEGDRSSIHPDDLPVLLDFFAGMKRGDEDAEAVLRLKMIDGSYQWTRLMGSFVRDKGGRLLRAIGTLTNVDDETKKNQQIKDTLNHVPAGICVYEVTQSGRIINRYADETLARMLGYSMKEYAAIIADNALEPTLPADYPIIEAAIAGALQGKKAGECAYRLRHKNGGIVWFNLRFHAASEKDERLFYALFTDITAEKERSLQYAALESRYGEMVNSSPGGISISEWSRSAGDYHVSYMNRQLKKMLGYDQESDELERRWTPDSTIDIHPDDMPGVSRKLARSFQALEPYHNRVRLRRKDGEYLWVDVSASFGENGGDACTLYAMYLDTTEAVEANERLHAQDERLRLLNKGMKTTTFEYDPARDAVIFSRGEENAVAQRLSEPGDHPARKVHPEDQGAYLAAFRRAGERAGTLAHEFRAALFGAPYQWCRATMIGVADARGRVCRVIGRIDDITREKELAQQYAIETDYNRFSGLGLIGAYRINLTAGVLEDCHASLSQEFLKAGMPMTNEVFRQISDAMIPDPVERDACFARMNPDQLREDWRRGITEKSVQYHIDLPDGSQRCVRQSSKLIKKPVNDEVVAMVNSFDVTDEENIDQVMRFLMNRAYDQIWVIDGKTGGFRVLTARDDPAGWMEETGDYAAAVADYAARHVTEDTRERYLRESALSHIMKRLRTADSFQSLYDITQPGGEAINRSTV